ncbi:hypothetical protein BE20_09080 [Sorangium cellulosum]|uniref:Uncharacterized protein n=1 Tax=Sorangium cellulosum TaxID=56 RepID=A0A150RBS3_SORCE|nr:hypothetical protein BE18_17770 [Sorangium cellulosum]KYF93579.1 hypothetical protein BE20_09080 [Sorangium cellulosum]
MPILDGLEFTQAGLRVRYRASLDPQIVTISVTTQGATTFPYAQIILRKLLTSINAGSAGGSRFPPTAGAAVVVDESPDLHGPSYVWKVRLAAVDPLFLRTMVEELRYAGAGHPVTSMEIAGSLPLDDTALSVREDDVKRWLDDPGAYLEEWPNPGFPIVERGRWAMFRLRLDAQITGELRRKLDLVALGWLEAVSSYLWATGEYEAGNIDRCMPRCGSSKDEFSAAYRDFYFSPVPARARLVNALSRFHHTVAPIALAEISP